MFCIISKEKKIPRLSNIFSKNIEMKIKMKIKNYWVVKKWKYINLIKKKGGNDVRSKANIISYHPRPSHSNKHMKKMRKIWKNKIFQNKFRTFLLLFNEFSYFRFLWFLRWVFFTFRYATVDRLLTFISNSFGTKLRGKFRSLTISMILVTLGFVLLYNHSFESDKDCFGRI